MTHTTAASGCGAEDMLIRRDCGPIMMDILWFSRRKKKMLGLTLGVQREADVSLFGVLRGTII